MARITLDVPDSVRERLDSLKRMSEAASITEVVRRALALYEQVIIAEDEGGRVLIEKKDGDIVHIIVM